MEEKNTNIIQSANKMNELDPFQHLDEIEKSLKALNRMTERPLVEIEFQNLTFTTVRRKKQGQNPILQGLSGKFHPGELVAIMGPSGAGKSTLLNILTGFNCGKNGGKILINGEPRDMRIYNKLACYIMQDDLLLPHFTVQESMELAASLKLGNELEDTQKHLVAEEVINALGLQKCKSTFVEKLSGGQRKRLSIALELVSNPPVIFLDEPTTGLDVVSTKQCISLLKILAKNGRTIICTIHQPSFPVLSLFDKVYVIAKGFCVFNGSPFGIVPFMDKIGHICPTQHNPSDFLLETIQSCEHIIDRMTKLIANGKICDKAETDLKTITNKADESTEIVTQKKSLDKIKMSLPASFWTQFTLLYIRMTVQKWRNKASFWIMVFHHTAVVFCYGSTFYQIGNDGSQVYANFKFCLAMVMYITYTFAMIPILLYPLEIDRLKREHFNRWYGLNAYFTANTFVNLPFMAIKLCIAISVLYLMTGQSLEIERYLLFCGFSLLTAVSAESYGFAIGSMTTPKNGAILGPAIIIPCLILSQYGAGFGPKIETYMTVIMHITSYVRYSVVGITSSFLKNRGTLECPDLYCHYANSEIFLRDLGIDRSSQLLQVVGILSFTFIYKLIGYLILYIRINRSNNNKILSFFIG